MRGLVLFSTISNSQPAPQTETQLKQAAQSHPSDWEANYRFGEFYLHTGRIADGVPWMEKAVALQPNNYVAGYDLALAYYDTKDYKKARRQIQLMLKTQNTADLYALRADVEDAAGNYLQAAAQYHAAAHLDPTEDRIFDWATDLIVHETYRPAIAIFSRGVELYPRSLKMNVGLGIAFYLDQQYEKGIKQLCTAADLAPSEVWPYLFLGSSYAANSSRIEAEEVKARLKRFASLHPDNAKALYYYAISLWDRNSRSEKETAEAEKFLKKSVALDPSFLDSHLQLGIFYAQRGDYAEAIPELASAIRLDPNLAMAHYHLAQAYSRTGDKALASHEFQTFQRLHREQTDESEKERNRVVQFVVGMRGQTAPAN